MRAAEATTLKRQLADALPQAAVAAAVRTALPSSRLDDDFAGRTLVLRYGPGTVFCRNLVERNRVLIADMLVGLADPDLPSVGLATEVIDRSGHVTARSTG